MNILANPNNSDLLVIDINDSIKFLNLTHQKPKVGVLSKDDFTSTSASLPKLPQHVDFDNVSCMTWCSSFGTSTANSVALGLNNGKVILLWPDLEQNHSINLNNGLIYQGSKPCTALAWNHGQPSLLAMGMDRSRSENSLLIWDLSSGHGSDVDDAKNGKQAHRPQYETCYAEAVNSTLWSKNDSKTVIAGVSNKSLRMYDLRNIRSPTSAVTTRAVFGLCQDPCLDTQFASYFENQLYTWDYRNFSKPAAVVSAKFNILKAEWCPTRKGLLATVSGSLSDGQIIRVYDLSHTMVTDSDQDIAYRHVEQIVKPNLARDETVRTFAWMVDQKNKLIAVTNTGTLHCVNVPERISHGWTKNSILMSACREHYQCLSFKNPAAEKAISSNSGIEHIMYERATNGYGLHDVDNHDTKINLEPHNDALVAFWKWIKKVKESPNADGIQDSRTSMNSRTLKSWHPNTSSNNKFSGLVSELTNQAPSTAQLVSWRGISNVDRTIYSSPQRTKALKMCGWSPHFFKLDENDTGFRNQLFACIDVKRATTVALWHLDMGLAIEILQRHTSNNAMSDRDREEYSIIAMALSGYTGHTASLFWKEMCNNLQKSVTSPYLRAAFAFLSGQGNGTYKDIIKGKDLSYLDRVGFACIFLPDDVLLEVLDTLSENAVEFGDLGGVVVTGLSSEKGIELLQNYVDMTKDVQTAALSLIQTGSNDILKNKNACHIIDGYRDLLNSWMLWKERAIVDNATGKMNIGLRTKQSLQSVFVQCNYCGKSVKHSARMQNIRGRGAGALQSHGMTNKVTSCPNCRKPLLRCSVCCMYLGTSPTDSYEASDNIQCHDADLDSWFTWCPQCQHGGHTSHLTTWFKDHVECPLSGCVCKCSLQSN
ncbi:GATOR2 complex protein MIOS-A-like [Styela clava]